MNMKGFDSERKGIPVADSTSLVTWVSTASSQNKEEEKGVQLKF